MARLLFLVHGMGHHRDAGDHRWHDEPVKVLRDAAERYGVRDRFDEKVRIHHITYDGVFHDYLGDMGDSLDALRVAMEENATDGLELVRWLDDRDITDTERNFFWSHVVDVLLYRFFPQIAAEVRARVLEQFVAVVNEAKATPPQPRVAILAHSLGTAVTHDALAELASRPFNGSGAYMASQGWRLDHLFMVANVSRVLSRLGRGFYASHVRCETAPEVPDVAPCVSKYFNFRHRLDPIPAVKAFSPAGWGRFYRTDETLDHMVDWNVHGFEHYVRHPDVHVPILNELLDFPVTEGRQREAVAELAQSPRPECFEVADRLRVQLRRVRDLVLSQPAVDTAAVVALIKVATETGALLEEAQRECRGMVP